RFRELPAVSGLEGVARDLQRTGLRHPRLDQPAINQARGGHSGHSRDARGDLLIHGRPLAARITGGIHVDPQLYYMRALETHRHGNEVAKCANEETGADQQLNRKREFDYYDGFAGLDSRWPSAVRSLVIEVGVGGGPGGAPGRD